MAYEVEWRPAAVRQFEKLEKLTQKRIAAATARLADQPKPTGAKKLKGRKDTYRIRSGFYRVIYTIQKKKLIVCVVRVAHRKEAY